MTYYMYIETGCAFEAESEEDAREQATAWYLPDWSIRTRKFVRPECLRTSANECCL